MQRRIHDDDRTMTPWWKAIVGLTLGLLIAACGDTEVSTSPTLGTQSSTAEGAIGEESAEASDLSTTTRSPETTGQASNSTAPPDSATNTVSPAPITTEQTAATTTTQSPTTSTQGPVPVADLETHVSELAAWLRERGGRAELFYDEDPQYRLRIDTLGEQYPGHFLVELQQGDCATLLTDGTIEPFADGFLYTEGLHPNGVEIVYETVALDCAETISFPRAIDEVFRPEFPNRRTSDQLAIHLTPHALLISAGPLDFSYSARFNVEPGDPPPPTAPPAPPVEATTTTEALPPNAQATTTTSTTTTVPAPATTGPRRPADLALDEAIKVFTLYGDHSLYGGLYLVDGGRGGVAINVVGPSAQAEAFRQELRALVDPSVAVEYRDVIHSLAALQAEADFISDDISRLARKWEASASWGVDEKSNNISVDFSSQEAIDEHRATGPRNDVSIEIRYELIDDIVLGDG